MTKDADKKWLCRKLGSEGSKTFRRVKHIKIYQKLGKCKRKKNVKKYNNNISTGHINVNNNIMQSPFAASSQSSSECSSEWVGGWLWLWLSIWLVASCAVVGFSFSMYLSGKLDFQSELDLTSYGVFNSELDLTSYGVFNWLHHYENPGLWWNEVIFYEDPVAKKGYYAVWNNARYTYKNTLESGEERWECTVRGCHNSIYLTADGVFLYYRTHHETYNQNGTETVLSVGAVFSKHKLGTTHEKWDVGRVTIEEAQKNMVEDVRYGTRAYNAYSKYILQNPDKAKYIPHRNRFKTKLKQERSKFYPKQPTVRGIPDAMQQNSIDGWQGNYYVHAEAIQNKRVSNHNNEEFAKWLQQTEDKNELQQKLSETKHKIAQLQQEADLISGKVTQVAGKNFKSNFFIGATGSGKQLIFGEEEAYQVAWECETLCGDGTWKPTPSVTPENNETLDMTWIIHGLKQSKQLIYAHEAFALFYVFFMKGPDTRTATHYSAVLEVIVSYGIKEYDINLLLRCKNVICDFDPAERLGFTATLNVYLNLCSGCNYHWVKLINKGIIDHGLWTLYTTYPDFCYLMKICKCVKDAPETMMMDAYALVYNAIPQFTPKDKVKQVQDMFNLYILPTWTVLYKPQEYCAFKKWVGHNNHSETKNLRVQAYVGTHTAWWEGLEKYMEFSALEMARWRSFKNNGFNRKKSKQEHMKKAAINKMWNLMSQDKTDIDLWTYMEGIKLCYDEDWNKFDARFGALTPDEVDF
eukprot:82814_1